MPARRIRASSLPKLQRSDWGAARYPRCLRLALVIALVAAAGCFGPSFGDVRCAEAQLCPDGLACVGGVCVDEAPDAGPLPPAALLGLATSAPSELSPPFEPHVLGYTLEVSLLVQELVVLTDPADGAEVSVNGALVDPTGASSVIALDFGLSTIVINSVNDGAARNYEITLSRAGNLAERLYVKASNAEVGDRFGAALAVTEAIAVVTATDEDGGSVGINGDEGDNSVAESGAAYVYRRQGTGWEKEAYLKVPNRGGNDRLGFSAAADGDIVVLGTVAEDGSGVGIDPADDDLASNAGAAYVYRRSASGWQLEAHLKPSNTDANDSFGFAVAISGETVVVGAPGEASNATGIGGDETNNGQNNAGAVYVFRRGSTGWAQEAYIKASNTQNGDRFGESIAIDDDLLAVGASAEDSLATGINGAEQNGAADAGAVYLFRRSGATWAQEAYVKASNTGVGDRFGSAVAVQGDRLVVGAFGEGSASPGVGADQANDGANNAGAAYLFERSGSAWSQTTYFKSSAPDSGDRFGATLALYRDIIAVGALQEDGAAGGINGSQTNGANNAGAAYVFMFRDGAWQQSAYVKAGAPGANDEFATSLAISRDALMVGAPLEDSGSTGFGGDPQSNATTNAGAGALFH